MSLLGDLIGIADDLTQQFGLQADVLFYRFQYADGAGKRYYAAAVARKAIYTRKMKQVRTFSGDMGVSNAQIAFIDPTVVGEFDKIVTPVGGVLDASEQARDAAQPIIGYDGFVDGSNGAVLSEIYLG